MAPALACGNTFVYKPSPLAPLAALVLAQILKVNRFFLKPSIFSTFSWVLPSVHQRRIALFSSEATMLQN